MPQVALRVKVDCLRMPISRFIYAVLAKLDPRRDRAFVFLGFLAGRPANQALPLQLRQDPMNQRNRDRPFAHGGRHPLHILGTNIPHGEYSGQARLQHQWHTR